MDELDYQRIPAIRHSWVRAYAERGAGYLKALMDGLTRPETTALRIGSAVHCALIEPDKFAERYAVRPRLDRRTKSGKTDAATLAVAEWLAPAPKPWVDESELELLRRMGAAVASHPKVVRLLETCDMVERAHTWQDYAFGSGLRCKLRLDLASSTVPLIVDLKSTDDPSPEGFARSVVRYGYDTQLVFYASGEAERRGISLDEMVLVLLAVEKQAPFRVALYELDDRWKRTAQAWLTKHMGQIALRAETNNWMDDWCGVRAELPVPSWYERERGVHV